jgi:hypothetical protein
VYCPSDLELCSDRVCFAWGCRISGASPLEACEDCGELVLLVRRLVICDGCLAAYGTRATESIAAISKG